MNEPSHLDLYNLEELNDNYLEWEFYAALAEGYEKAINQQGETNEEITDTTDDDYFNSSSR